MAWGNNNHGQLGNGGTTDELSPVQIFASGVASVAAGYWSSHALKTDGSLWSWGDNYVGQLGDGTTTDRDTPKCIFDAGIAFVTSGPWHTLAIKTDCSLWGWGGNGFCTLGIGSNIGGNPELLPIPIMKGVVSVAGHDTHSLAAKKDGSLWIWGGDNFCGELGGPYCFVDPVCIWESGAASVEAGIYRSVIVKKDGSLWGCGDNDCGQLLGDGTTADQPVPVPTVMTSNVASVAAGWFHTLVIKKDGSLWAWGANNYGQVGNGTTTNQLTPVHIMDDVVAVAAGGFHSLALKSDGTLWAWGCNDKGQLGDGTTDDSLIPKQIY